MYVSFCCQNVPIVTETQKDAHINDRHKKAMATIYMPQLALIPLRDTLRFAEAKWDHMPYSANVAGQNPNFSNG